MTDSRAAVGFDRLPWLADEPDRQRRGSAREVAGWIVSAVLIVAGVAYWLGQRTANEVQSPPAVQGAQHSATMPLPVPQPVQPLVEPDRTAQVEPATEPATSLPRPTIERFRPGQHTQGATRRIAVTPSSAKPREQAHPTLQTPTLQTKAPAASKPAAGQDRPLTLWPSRVSQGASGRLVQIGAFGTRQQAKLGWRHMVRAYPGVIRLPAVVVEARNSRGRPFYRFQIGTTSQAHSEVLCQRMQRIRFSCAVVGLPGAKKAIER